MAPLPDLRTRYITDLSWWNALDHGVNSLDPVDLLDYPDVESWESYDNGIEGSLRRHDALRFRAKTDGYILTYFDTTYGSVQPEDFLSSFNAGTTPDLTKTLLSEEINALRKQASNSDKMTFRHRDVGLYNYRYPDMDHYRVFSRDREDGYAFSPHSEYAVNPDSDLPEHYVVNTELRVGAYLQFDGDTVADSGGLDTLTTTVRLADRITEKDYYYTTRSWIPLAGSAATTTLIVE